MAKKEKAVYAPGELSRVREKLGTFNDEEAKKLVQKLGGVVGYERTEDQEKARQSAMHKVRRERVEVKIGDNAGFNIPKNRIELPTEDEMSGDNNLKRKPYRRKELDPEDDPSIPLKISYWDRIKMDKFAGQPEFDIKSPGQVFVSMISIFTDIPDYVNSVFVTRRMTEYYRKIENLVVSTRTLFPRNNMKRNEKMKRSAPLVYAILDVIRYWNIEKISGDLARIQSHPRNAKVSDFAEILRAIYRPLFILELLDPDAHIRGAYKILYKLLYIENPIDAQAKYQEHIRSTLQSFFEIRRDVHFLLYPLLMKSVSSKFVYYERFFIDRRNRIMSFLNVSEEDQINPTLLSGKIDAKAPEADAEKDEVPPELGEIQDDKKEDNPEEIKALKEEEEAELRALDRGLEALEALFPKAGWDRLSVYPDLYPYFADIFDLRRGIVNIAPTDPMQQILILMRILEELFFGLRYVSFGAIPDYTGKLEGIDSLLGEIINDWRHHFEISFQKEYIPRLSDYIRILEGSSEERSSTYTKKVLAELHWIKRLYFLPYYKFESLIPPPFSKKSISPIYSEIAKLRRYLTMVAAGIEHGNKAGGAATHAPCDGIDNPWEPYVFQVPNPLSTRLDSLLAQKVRNNASLVFFCLAVTTVLDYIVNNENSWAYGPVPGPLFRSINGEGVLPLTGVDTRIDAETIFKQSIRQRQKKAEQEQ